LPICGSCDDELSIKGIPSHLLSIGNWEDIHNRGQLQSILQDTVEDIDDDREDDIGIEYVDS